MDDSDKKIISHESFANETNIDTNNEIDPFAYLERGDFSSEIFKIELSNLPKKFGIAQLKKKLLHLKLKPCKVKSVEHGHYAYVTFRNEADKEEAIKVLEGHIWKSKPIRVKSAAANADPFLLKRKLEAETDQDCDSNAKKSKSSDDGDAGIKLNDIVTPYWKIPYEEQLQNKNEAITTQLRRLTKEIGSNNEDLAFVIADKKMKYDGLCCLLHPLSKSPVVTGYRNKAEFTIGVGIGGKERVIGFRMGSYRNGDLTVVSANDCINIPTSMKTVLEEIQGYLDSRSDVESFNPCTRKGFWKHAMIRTSSDNSQVLLNLVCHPQQLEDDELKVEREKFQKYYEDLSALKSTPVTSLYVQFESDRKERYEEIMPVHLLGEEFIVETLLGMKFQISPLSFFQVNTPAAEILYSAISKLCKVDSNTILVDACCGTGTIGLTMARQVKRVIGIEINTQAIKDAKKNAELNGIDNVEYISGKVEDVLPGIVKGLSQNEQVVVVVDPPRAGLHSDFIKTIRKATFITRLVYVSCKLTAAIQNIVDLTRQPSKRMIGKAFQLQEVLGVDMFPQTDMYETVLLLER